MTLLHSFLDIVRTIRLNDIIDMAIMAFVFYKVLYFLARTGSGRVLRGILFLLLALGVLLLVFAPMTVSSGPFAGQPLQHI